MEPTWGSLEGSTGSVGACAAACWLPVSAATAIPIPTLKPLDLVIAIVLGSQSGRCPTFMLGPHHPPPPVQRAAGIIGIGAHGGKESHSRGFQPRLRDPKILHQ